MTSDQANTRPTPQRCALPTGATAFALLLSGCFYNNTKAPDPYAENAYPPSQYGQYPYQDSNTAYDDGAGVTSLPGDGGPVTYGNVPPETTPPTGLPTSPAGSRSHTVVAGDNLYRIGKQYGVSMQALMSANNLTSATIFPGQQLIIP